MATVAPVQRMTRCSRCGTNVPTESAVAYRVTFTTVSKPAKTIRSRTLEWLCPDCLGRDEVWNLPPYSSPGDLL